MAAVPQPMHQRAANHGRGRHRNGEVAVPQRLLVVHGNGAAAHSPKITP